MPARAARMRLASISVVLLVFSTGVARNASAGPIDLENDATVAIANTPPATCCGALIIGAPRLVPDMSNAGDLLLFTLHFLDMSVQNLQFDSFIGLNIADAGGNEVFQPGQNIPLQLTYAIPTSSSAPNGGLLPASDIIANLGSFDGFGLLPAGDLLFTVTLALSVDLPFGQVFRINDPTDPNNSRTTAATLTVTGPGTVVPEPSTLVLLLAGLAGTGLGARRLRVGHRSSKN
jgi:hypothetical protein